ncbi:MAG: PIN domain-containing protein, partial [Spirochaetales bacterium]|nr:PIN domain-containing protein [Spirochaetales bacterium]
MKFILDTNVLSELTKQEPDKNVLEWFNNCPEDKMYISSITLGEIETGISSLDPGKKQNQLMLWFGSL